MNTGPDAEFDLVCEVCQTGHVQPRRGALVEWVGDEFITVPNFPMWVCDLCGAHEYDAGALEQLQAVLGPRAALPGGRPAARSGPGRGPGLPRSPGRHSV